MKPATGSASAFLVFEGCEARFHDTYVIRAHDLSGSAANLGTACHGALERWVKLGWHFPQQPFVKLIELFDEEYAKLFADNSRRAEGRKIMENWYKRSGDDYWEGRTVLTTEEKKFFTIKAPWNPEYPINYILDRLDMKNGEPEVVDYKSVAMPVQPEELKGRIQPRLYALATQIEFPEALGIWVTYDLLRYDCVSVRFTREDNAATWRYLKELVKRIHLSDGTTETLNPECRWCIRKLVCEELRTHQSVGGPMAITDLATAIDMRAKIDHQLGGLHNLMTELDDYILAECEEQEILDTKTSLTEMKVSVTGKREVDSERIAPILGPEIMSRYGKINVGTLDTILETEDLSDSQKSQIKMLVRRKMNKPSIKTKPIAKLDPEES